MSIRIDLHKSDCVTWLASLESGSSDLIVTDPAYQSLEKHRAMGTTTRLKKSKGSSSAWFKIFPNSRFPEFFEQCYRVLRKNRHLYVICDHETMFVIRDIGIAAGFHFWKPLIWFKEGRIGMGYHYRGQFEVVLFFEKKGRATGRKLHNASMGDVLRHTPVRTPYPTEKPVGLLTDLIGQSSDEGELVLDPFFGSGSAAVACQLLQRNFSGSDVSDFAHEYARERLFPFGGGT